uniref:Uncharacterized protein n=1 Tax=Solanum lycopersicum TaxID=4081 RepID=A0A3Q7EBW5_SOLLC
MRKISFDAEIRLGWQEQHLLGYGEVAKPTVKIQETDKLKPRTKLPLTWTNSSELGKQFVHQGYEKGKELVGSE